MALAVVLFNLLWFVYSPALRGPFVYDDIPGIAENTELRQVSKPWLVFRDHESSLEFDRRPVTALSFVLNHAVTGLSPRACRGVNIVLHWLVGMLLVATIVLIAKRMGAQTPRLSGWSLVTLWLFHPLATSAVSYAYQRSEILMALFFVLSTVAVLRADEGGQGEHRWLGVSFASAILSGLSKEVGVVLLAALPLVERVCVFSSWSEFWRRRKRFYCSLSLVFAAMTIWLFTGVRSGELNDGGVLASPWGYFQSQCRVLWRYLALVFWPHPQIFTPAPKHPGEVLQWLPQGISLALVILLGIWVSLKKRWVLLPTGLFFIVLAPTSSFLPIPLEPDVEFRMYLPSVFVLAVVAIGVGAGLRSQWGGRAIGCSLYLLVFLALLGMNYRRNQDYSSASRLWQSVLRYDPLNAKALYHLGHAALEEGDLETVHACGMALRKLGAVEAIPLASEGGVVLLALWHIEQGDPKQGTDALLVLSKGGSALPGLDFYCALGLVRSGRLDEARHLLATLNARGGTQLGPRFVEAELLVKSGRREEARAIYSQLAKLVPHSWRTHQLAKLLDSNNSTE